MKNVNKQNPYHEAAELSAWEWMWKHHKTKLVGVTLFGLIFVVAPWLSIELSTTTQVLISLGVFLWIVFGNFYRIYTIYKKNLRGYSIWENSFGNK